MTSEYSRLMALDENGLRACPFCDDNDVLIHDKAGLDGKRYYICCMGGGIRGCCAQDYSYATKREAVKAWNTRASDALLRKQHELLGKAEEALEESRASVVKAVQAQPNTMNKFSRNELDHIFIVTGKALTLLREGKETEHG